MSQVRITSLGGHGLRTTIEGIGADSMPFKIHKVEVALSVDSVNTATLHAVGVAVDVHAEATVVCACPHCGKQLKVL